MYKGLLSTPPSKLRAPHFPCNMVWSYYITETFQWKDGSFPLAVNDPICRLHVQVGVFGCSLANGATRGQQRAVFLNQGSRSGSVCPHPHLSPSGIPTGEITGLIQSRKPGVPCFCFQLVHFLRGLSTFTCAFVHSFTPSFIRHLLSLFWAPFWALSVQNTFDCFIKSFPSCESCQLSGGIVTQWNWHIQRTQITWVQPCVNAPFTRVQIPLDSRSSWTHLFLTPPCHHTCISSTQRRWRWPLSSFWNLHEVRMLFTSLFHLV